MRRRLYEVIETSSNTDIVGRSYDFFNAFIILVGLLVSILSTFDTGFESLLTTLEFCIAGLFFVDYLLRLYTAKYRYSESSEVVALLRYMFSFTGIIDLMSSIPFFFSGATAFRVLRVIRIFRLFRINAYYDALHVITTILSRKKKQLLSSVFIILVLMLSASLCMYSIEHDAQPEVFKNAFSGIWWAANTLLTVGYGDIYPITTLGKFFSIVVTFLGVGLVAVPTGILSAGFVEQYQLIDKQDTLSVRIFDKSGTLVKSCTVAPDVSLISLTPEGFSGYIVVSGSSDKEDRLYII